MMTEQEREILLNKIEEWHEKGLHQYIVEAITHFKVDEWNDDLKFKLARAYSLLGTPTHLEYFEEALRVLDILKHDYQDDANWNYQVAFALYYLYRPAEARRYLKHAIEVQADPAENVLELLDLCEEALQFPRFPVDFPKMVEASWTNFAKHEAKLRQMLDEKQDQEEILRFTEQALRPIMHDAYFQVGKDGDRYNLIFATDSSRASILEYLYFEKNVPAELKENWNIHCGAPQVTDIENRSLVVNGIEIRLADLQYKFEKTEKKEIEVQIYHEEMAKSMPIGMQMQAVSVLTKQLFGEARFLRFVSFIKVLDKAEEGLMNPSDFLDLMRLNIGEEQWDNTNDFSYLWQDNFDLVREPNGHELENWYPRKDITALHTIMPELVKSYDMYDDRIMNYYHRHGIVPGFLIMTTADKNLGEFEESFKELVKDIPQDLFNYLGFGVGHYYYVDLLMWDMTTVLTLIEKALKDNDHFKLVSFSTFRRGNDCIKVKADLSALTDLV